MMFFGLACVLCSSFGVMCNLQTVLCAVILHVLCVAFRASSSPLRGSSLASLASLDSLACHSKEKFLKLLCQQY